MHTTDTLTFSWLNQEFELQLSKYRQDKYQLDKLIKQQMQIISPFLDGMLQNIDLEYD